MANDSLKVIAQSVVMVVEESAEVHLELWRQQVNGCLELFHQRPFHVIILKRRVRTSPVAGAITCIVEVVSMSAAWQDIAKRKQEERDSRIPKDWVIPAYFYHARPSVLSVPYECGLLSKQELDLTERHDATALLSGLSTGLLKSEDVVTAFCKRAAVAQQVTNCLAEIMFEDAIKRAKWLDDEFARTGKPFGPLHGLPISIKDSFRVKGYDTSIGVAAFCFKPATENSALVDLLLDLGAVLYCKTNVPQTMMALDSFNNVFGRTMNPANQKLTAGGSTGGEGALVAMKGSVLGIGTDIGGSIRVPALCNGLFGVKPSHGRVPYAGQESGTLSGASKLGIESTAGPIARSMRDCELLLRVVCDALPSKLDPDCLDQTWTQQTSLPQLGQKKLVVGIARTDGHVTPLPPVQELMEEISKTLVSLSSAVEVVELDLKDLGPQCLKTFNGVMSTDGANTWFDHLEKTGEPLHPWLATRLRRRPAKGLNDVRAIQGSKVELQTEFLKVWNEDGGYWRSISSNASNRKLDVLLIPAAPHPVAPIDRWNSTNYTSMFNLLDLPAGMLPVRNVREQDLQEEVPTSKPLNGWDKINRELWTDVDRKQYLGSALSVQVVAPRLAERKLVEAMSVLEEALRPLREEGGGKSKL